MQETGQKAVMLSFRLPAAERDAFKAWCAERHTTVQAPARPLLSIVARGCAALLLAAKSHSRSG